MGWVQKYTHFLEKKEFATDPRGKMTCSEFRDTVTVILVTGYVPKVKNG
jgi:hypothetical protein